MRATPLKNGVPVAFPNEVPEVVDGLGQRVRVGDWLRPVGWTHAAARVDAITGTRADAAGVMVRIVWLRQPTQDVIELSAEQFTATKWRRCDGRGE